MILGAPTDALLQEHYVLLLGAAIFLELAGAALFLANYSAGAYMLVRPRPYLALHIEHLVMLVLCAIIGHM